MAKHTLPSGAELDVTVAPFADADALTKALLKAVKGVELRADILQMDMTAIKDVVVGAATSDEVDRALFKCAERASYNGVKVSKGLFDDPEIGTQAREDYYHLCLKVIEVNCLPFFKAAFSELKTRLKGMNASQPSK